MKFSFNQLVCVLLVMVTFTGCNTFNSGIGFEVRTPQQRFEKLEKLSLLYLEITEPLAPLAEDANALEKALYERKLKKRNEKKQDITTALSVYKVFVSGLYGDGLFDTEVEDRKAVLALIIDQINDGEELSEEELIQARSTLLFLDLLGVTGLEPYMELLGATPQVFE